MKKVLISAILALLLSVASCGGEMDSTTIPDITNTGNEPSVSPSTPTAVTKATLNPRITEELPTVVPNPTATTNDDPSPNPPTPTVVPTATLKPGFSEARPTVTPIPTTTSIPTPTVTQTPTSPPTSTMSPDWIRYELEVQEYFLFNYASYWAMLDNKEFANYWTDWQNRINEEKDGQEKAGLQEVYDGFYNTGCQPAAWCPPLPDSATDAERAEFVINKAARGVNEYTKAAVACYLVAWPDVGDAYSPLLGVYRTSEQYVWHIIVTGPSSWGDKQEFRGTYNSQKDSCVPEHLGTRLPVSAADLLADRPEFPEPPPR